MASLTLTTADTKAWIAQAEEQYVQCRTKGHRKMGPYTARKLRVPGKPEVAYEEVEKCACGARRVALLNSRGHILSARYDYTDCPGYLVKGGRMIGASKDYPRLHLLLAQIKSQDAA